MQDSTALKIAAIASITFLETIALLVLHIDGVLLTSVIAVISGIAGYQLKEIRLKKQLQEGSDG